MNASEIAETLLNGNIARARNEICCTEAGVWNRDPYEVAVKTLEVVSALANDAPPGCAARDRYQWALGKVWRCLEGAP